jgi:hypothetical protein
LALAVLDFDPERVWVAVAAAAALVDAEWLRPAAACFD